MYVDKPLRGHGLMQAIARVNRVFKDKPGGLVVDYLGLAHELKRALATYTESGGTGRTALDQDEAVAVMREKYEVCCGLFGLYTTPKGVAGGFDRSKWSTGTPQERLGLLPRAQEHILAHENGKDRYQNRAIEAAQVIEELIQLAREMREANARGETLGLSEDELAFYDPLETNDSAVKVLGDETLRDIARELVETVRNNVTIDWTLREIFRKRSDRAPAGRRCVAETNGRSQPSPSARSCASGSASSNCRIPSSPNDARTLGVSSPSRFRFGTTRANSMPRNARAGGDARTCCFTSSRFQPIALAIWSPTRRFRISSQA
jgi:hypothetical protein